MILLICLFFCHWIADYSHLALPWLKAKREGRPLLPILLHSMQHGLLMSVPLLVFVGYSALWAHLIIFEISTHFVIDVWKGRMNGWFPSLQNAQNVYHWYVFGFDQFLHSVVIILMFKYAE